MRNTQKINQKFGGPPARMVGSLFFFSLYSVLVTACSSDMRAEDGSADMDEKANGAEAGTSGMGEGAGAPGPQQPDGNPEESEQEGAGSLVSPVVSGNFVFHRSATQSKVSGINSETLKIQSFDVGYPPVALAAVPNPPVGGAKVAVLGRTPLAAEIAMVTLSSDGKSGVQVHTVARGVNDILVDPTGRFVFAYHNVNAKVGAQAGSDQELSVLSLGSNQVVNLSVGAHPREVVFSKDATRAFVITADGVSVLNLSSLGDGGKQPLIPVVPRIGLDPDRIEIRIDASTGQAIARATDINKLWVTDLSSGSQYEYALSGPATDLDVVEGRAFAVIPGEQSSSLIELDLPAAQGSVVKVVNIDGAYVGVGEYAKDGQTALLYTTRKPGGDATADRVEASRKRLTVMRRGSGDWADQQRLFVELPIREVGISPDNANAVLLHSGASPLNVNAPYAYTLIDLSAQFPIKKLQHVVSPLNSLLFTPNGDRAALTSRAMNSSQSSIEIVSLRSFVVQSRQLASPAVQLGYIEKPSLIFVSQQHPLGRVSLFDAKGDVQTVTGFELDDGVKAGQ